MQSAVYYYWLHVFKKLGRAGGSPLLQMKAAAQAGTAAVIITTPLWVCNTRMILSEKSRIGSVSNLLGLAGKVGSEKRRGWVSTLVDIVKTDGILALWSGLGPSLLLVANPSVQSGAEALLLGHGEDGVGNGAREGLNDGEDDERPRSADREAALQQRNERFGRRRARDRREAKAEPLNDEEREELERLAARVERHCEELRVHALLRRHRRAAPVLLHLAVQHVGRPEANLARAAAARRHQLERRAPRRVRRRELHEPRIRRRALRWVRVAVQRSARSVRLGSGRRTTW